MMTPEQRRTASSADPDAIKRDIDATRGRVDQTLHDLHDRVSPRQIWGRALNRGKDLATGATESFRRNPLPTVFTVTGVLALWMLAAGRGSRRERAMLTEKADLGERIRERVREHFDEAEDLDERIETPRMRLRRMRDRGSITRLADEAPLLLGALGIALGALLGASLPPTETEDRVMGNARDTTLKRAREVASQSFAKARDAARDAASAIRERTSSMH